MKERYIYEKDRLPKPVLEGHEDWIELYYKAWELAFANVQYPEKEGWKPQLTCMPDVKTIWIWDSCFMTFITNYSNGTLSALNNLDNIYKLRRKADGFIGMAYDYPTDSEAYPGRINPPLFAWAEWRHYLISGCRERLEQVIPVLEGVYSFIEKNRKREMGLYWFEDSGSSGMDNSPRSAYPSRNLDGSDICHVDLAAQQALGAYCISKIAAIIGESDKEDFYFKEHKRICDLINCYHWSERSGFYFDCFNGDIPPNKAKLLSAKTLAAIWPILAGATDGEQLQKMIEILFDEEKFYTTVPFASLSADDPNYDATGGYWLGGVWAPTNYALINGLKNNGKEVLAREAAIKYLTGMSEIYQKVSPPTIWEAYAPESYTPATCEDGARVRGDFVGWSGLGPITMLIENIIGFDFDASKNTITFNLSHYGQSGIENILFNGGYVSVVCTKHKDEDGESLLYIKTEKEFTLYVKKACKKEAICIYAKAGEHDYYI